MADDAARMRKILDQLTQDERLVCIWRLAGFSTRDIARQLKQSEADVDSIFERAQRKLRRSLHDPSNVG